MELQNVTNYSVDILPVGTICNLMNKIDPTDDGVMCTIKKVEQDDEIKDLFWYYVVANNPEKNDKFEYGLGYYFDLVPNTSDLLIILSEPTLY